MIRGSLRIRLLESGMLRIPAWFALALLAGCMGGTGTDTENGMEPVRVTARVADSTGAPVPGLEIQLRPLQARPDSAVAETVFSPKTDGDGLVQIHLDTPGVYIAEGHVVGLILFLDTLRAEPGVSPDTANFLARAPRPFQGRVRLKSGFRVDTGTVFLRGTSRYAPIRSDGSYDLGLLPPEAARMLPELRFNSSPLNRRFVQFVDPTLMPDDSTAPEEDSALFPGGRIGVLGPADSVWATCMEDTLGDTRLSFVANGYLGDDHRLAEIVSNLCPDLPGTLTRVDIVDPNGGPRVFVGEYVRPDELVFPDEGGLHRPVALPAVCLHEDAGSSRLPARFRDGEIRVDDLKHGQGCLE